MFFGEEVYDYFSVVKDLFVIDPSCVCVLRGRALARRERVLSVCMRGSNET